MKETLQIINQMLVDGVIRKYAIGGAVGATFYLEPSATLDIDIFVSFETAPGRALILLSPIYDYLKARGCREEGEHVVIGGWPVQFLPAPDALAEEAVAQAVETDVEGVRTWVMTAEHLVAIALQTGRAKDHIRILQFIDSGMVDADTLDAILARHGFLEQWEQFGHKFLEDRK